MATKPYSFKPFGRIDHVLLHYRWPERAPHPVPPHRVFWGQLMAELVWWHVSLAENAIEKSDPTYCADRGYWIERALDASAERLQWHAFPGDLINSVIELPKGGCGMSWLVFTMTNWVLRSINFKDPFRGSFSVVSTPMFETKASFFSAFGVRHFSLAPPQISLNFLKTSAPSCKIRMQKSLNIFYNR